MPDFVILGNSQWNSPSCGGGHSSEQYAHAVLHRGWRVSFFQRDGRNFETPLAEMQLGPGTVAMCDVPWVDYYYDLFLDLKAKGCATVYRIIDNWLLTPRSEYCEERESALIRLADVAFSSSPLNIERFVKVRPDLHLLRNGVVLEPGWSWQAPRPADLAMGEPTVGLIASFWDTRWFDWTSLIHAAKCRPRMAINVFGNRERIEGAGFGPIPDNVHLLGVRQNAELPSYLRHCDVGIVPYDYEMTRYNNMLKVLEYLGCRLPVVCTPNVSLADYPYVYFYHGPEDFIAQIDRAVSTPIDCEFLYRFLQHHTWDAGLQCILDRLRSFLPIELEGMSQSQDQTAPCIR